MRVSAMAGELPRLQLRSGGSLSRPDRSLRRDWYATQQPRSPTAEVYTI